MASLQPPRKYDKSRSRGSNAIDSNTGKPANSPHSLANQKRLALSQMLSKAQDLGKRRELAEFSDLLAEETSEIKRRLEADEKQTRAQIRYLTGLIQEKDKMLKLIKMRQKVVAKRWKTVEDKYLKRIHECDQELVMIQAKTEEVRQRITILTKSSVGKPNIPFGDFNDDLCFDRTFMQMFARINREAQYGDDLPLSDDFGFELPPDCRPRIGGSDRTKRLRIDRMREELDKLGKECRSLQKLRDDLIEQKKANEEDENKA